MSLLLKNSSFGLPISPLSIQIASQQILKKEHGVHFWVALLKEMEIRLNGDPQTKTLFDQVQIAHPDAESLGIE